LNGQEEEEKKQLSKEEAAHAVAARHSEAESKNLGDLEAKLKDAEKNLRKYRRSEDADGGVSVKEKPALEPCPPARAPKPCKNAARTRGFHVATIVSALVLALCSQ